MRQRNPYDIWAKAFRANTATLTRRSLTVGTRTMARIVKPVVARQQPPPGPGDWIAGVAFGPTGTRRYRLYRPPGVRVGERLPLIVMLHGCGQDAKSFAASTRMNRVAARERFLVLYPEQDRMSNAQGCWNWFETRSGRHHGEAASIMRAIDQVCLLYSSDRAQVAIAGLSSGASMAALLVTRHPERFKAVVMHSGVPPGTARSAISAIGAMHGLRPTAPLNATPIAMASSWPPLLVIHGESDQVVAMTNGEMAVRVWADAAGAREVEGRHVQRGRRYDTTVTDFKCGRNTVSTLVQVDQLGHAWSGGSANHPFSDQQGPDASRMIWAFAAKQFRRSI